MEKLTSTAMITARDSYGQEVYYVSANSAQTLLILENPEHELFITSELSEVVKALTVALFPTYKKMRYPAKEIQHNICRIRDSTGSRIVIESIYPEMISSLIGSLERLVRPQLPYVLFSVGDTVRADSVNYLIVKITGDPEDVLYYTLISELGVEVTVSEFELKHYME